MQKLTFEQAIWLTLFALIGFVIILRLEQLLVALQKSRVVFVKNDTGNIIEAKFVDVTDKENAEKENVI